MISISSSAKSLNTRDKEVSVETDKLYQFYFTSFFLVMLRVLWDYVRLSPAKMTRQKKNTLRIPLLYSTLVTPSVRDRSFWRQNQWSRWRQNDVQPVPRMHILWRLAITIWWLDDSVTKIVFRSSILQDST